MKYFIRFLSYLPAFGVGLSSLLLFIESFDFPILIPIYILDMLGAIYLFSNSDNIAQNIDELLNILSSEE